MKAVIVGAGIGGLTAAIALRQAGVEAVVYERAEEIRPLGAGLNLWSNALLAYERLGIKDEVVAAGVPLELQEHLTHSGRLIARWPVGEWGRRLGAPTVGLARPDLHAVLTAALGDGGFELGHECTGFRQDGDGVTALFANGAEAHGDVLVGADGVRSAVRAGLLGPAQPRYSGVTSWRAIVDYEHELVPPGRIRLHWGRGRQLNVYRVGGNRIYWLALTKAPEGGSDPPGTRKETVLGHYRDFCAPVPELIEATPDALIFRTDIVDRDPSAVWGEGRVTLLGDAIHPMTPNLAQGACQAIEDAVVLARCLGEAADPVAGLRAYEEARRDRANSFVTGSRRGTNALAVSSPVGAGARNLALSAIFRTVAPKQQQQWMDYAF